MASSETDNRPRIFVSTVEGGFEGAELGVADGTRLGDEVGCVEGGSVGAELGVADGTRLGDEVGCVEGALDSAPVYMRMSSTCQ